MHISQIKVGSMGKMMKNFFWIRKIHLLSNPEVNFFLTPSVGLLSVQL